MINRIFSIFDPSCSLLLHSYFITLTLVYFSIPLLSRIKSSQWHLINKVQNNIKREVNQAIQEKKGNVIVSMSLFLIILYTNSIALFPQNFARSSQITFTLTLAIIIWIRRLIYGMTKNTKKLLCHLVPQGTPVALINFIVLIEIISTIIRPITLCVRLTANILAGHLLMSLLRNFVINNVSYSGFLLMTCPFLLTTLESAVSLIQAYVFITLVTLYSNEIR
jgi:F-type H+-transporting ATPase subunit a